MADAKAQNIPRVPYLAQRNHFAPSLSAHQPPLPLPLEYGASLISSPPAAIFKSNVFRPLSRYRLRRAERPSDPALCFGLYKEEQNPGLQRQASTPLSMEFVMGSTPGGGVCTTLAIPRPDCSHALIIASPRFQLADVYAQFRKARLPLRRLNTVAVSITSF
ncbi:hypothetical protein LNP74_28165 [Klebsiella pneumoniae subsp. pneumoniae]|nr:hypothetical protein [Klebsiella pneumoniae subsp. pneumoniae]